MARRGRERDRGFRERDEWSFLLFFGIPVWMHDFTKRCCFFLLFFIILIVFGNQQEFLKACFNNTKIHKTCFVFSCICIFYSFVIVFFRLHFFCVKLFVILVVFMFSVVFILFIFEKYMFQNFLTFFYCFYCILIFYDKKQ